MTTQQIGDLIYILNKDLTKQLEQVLKNNKMNLGQLQTLMIIKRLEQDKKTTQGLVAKETNLDKSNTCRSLKKLAQEGLVIIETNEADARKNTIQITQAGETELMKQKQDLQDISTKMLIDISQQEQQIFQATLIKMISNLKGE